MTRKTFLSTAFPTAIVSAVLAACSPDATDPVGHHPPIPSFAVLDGLPAPELRSAALVGTSQGFAVVRLTFLDNATDEALVSAYFTAADGSVMTQSIAGTPGTGERVVDVYAPKNVATAQINFMFNDSSVGTTCGCLFGPSSSVVTVTSGTTGAASPKRKGRSG